MDFVGISCLCAGTHPIWQQVWLGVMLQTQELRIIIEMLMFNDNPKTTVKERENTEGSKREPFTILSQKSLNVLN